LEPGAEIALKNLKMNAGIYGEDAAFVVLQNVEITNGSVGIYLEQQPSSKTDGYVRLMGTRVSGATYGIILRNISPTSLYQMNLPLEIQVQLQLGKELVRDTFITNIGQQGLILWYDAEFIRSGVAELTGLTIDGGMGTSYGVGIYGQGVQVYIRNSLIRGCKAYGMLVSYTRDFMLYRTLIANVYGDAGFPNADGRPNFGDGLMVLESSSVSILSSWFSSNARAGLLVMNSSGRVYSVASSYNRFGVVIQGEIQPDLVGANSFAYNSEQGKIIDGDLAIPEPAEVPPPPT
jgi:hypothetical protein